MTMAQYVLHVRAFSGWLSECSPVVSSPAQITRPVLEDWLLSVRSSGLATGTKASRIGAVRLFLEEQWNDGLAGLPRDAVIHAGEIPSVRGWLPRGIEPHVFEQFIDPTNLAVLGSEQHRTVILLLAFTGLRVSSVVTLPRDALQIGSDHHPYLRYLNVKLAREAVLPIGPTLVEQLRRQEDALTEIYGPQGTPFLLPSPPARLQGGSSRGGEHHLSLRTVRDIVKSYVRKARIRDSHGQLAVWVHPHRFRHHLGTSMINEGVPLPVIQRVLDHASIQMTARYSQLDNATIKREITAFHDRVNIRGERIALPVDGPLEQAAWMKERIARAKQALPNGYCGLPLVQSCPHPNACLSCENFLTDSTFRDIHEQQLTHTRTLRERAQQKENMRLVDLLEADERSLRRILDSLDTLDSDTTAPPASASIDVIELATRRNTAKDQTP